MPKLVPNVEAVHGLAALYLFSPVSNTNLYIRINPTNDPVLFLYK